MSKLTLQLSPEMDRVLDQLADSRQLPKAQILRRAMLLMQFLDDQVADDQDIVLRDRRTGETSRLVFESQLTDRRSTRAPASEPADEAAAAHADQSGSDQSSTPTAEAPTRERREASY